jgi:hypothetical protein
LPYKASKKENNKKEFLEAAFAFIKTSENRVNRNENVQTLLLLCAGYCSSFSKGEGNASTIEVIRNTIGKNNDDVYGSGDACLTESENSLPEKVQDAYDEFWGKSEEALKILNPDFNIVDESELSSGFNKKEAMDNFQALVNELNRIDFHFGEFKEKFNSFLE